MKRLKVCIVAICYNAHADAHVFLKSIAAAFNGDCGIDLSVIMADNSDFEAPNEVKYFSCDFLYHYLDNFNIGYFPAFYGAVCELDFDLESYDYTIVSNVDLTLSTNFFEELSTVDYDPTIGLFAPSIVSLNDGRDLNPKITSKPSKIKIKLLRLISSYPLVFLLHQSLHQIKMKIFNKKGCFSPMKASDSQIMYAAHGAFMVFTKIYFKRGASINYPRFLFAEEVFVAEQTASHGLKIAYKPSLVVHDKEHGSTSLQATKFICGEHKKSYDYCLSNYY